MTTEAEWSQAFDLLWNNIMSNQAPGLNEYEKSVFLTKGQLDVVKSHCSPKTNAQMEGVDDSELRQSDFISLIETLTLSTGTPSTTQTGSTNTLDPRAGNIYYQFPDNLIVILNEELVETYDTNKTCIYSVVPISYSEYARLMKKPYKYPPKGLAWRLISGTGTTTSGQSTMTYTRAELIARFKAASNPTLQYTLRYIRKPDPIIVGGCTQNGLTIEGKYTAASCALPSQLHDEILLRAVQLAKAAWVDTKGQ